MHFSSWKENNRFGWVCFHKFPTTHLFRAIFSRKRLQEGLINTSNTRYRLLQRLSFASFAKKDAWTNGYGRARGIALRCIFKATSSLLCLFCKLCSVKAGNTRESWSEQSVPYLRIFFIGPACKTHLALSFNIKTRLHLQEARIATLVSES